MVTLNNVRQYPRAFANKLRDQLILTDDEVTVFDMTLRDMSAQQIADSINASRRTVFRRKKNINEKLKNLSFDTDCTIDKTKHLFDNWA